MATLAMGVTVPSASSRTGIVLRSLGDRDSTGTARGAAPGAARRSPVDHRPRGVSNDDADQGDAPATPNSQSVFSSIFGPGSIGPRPDAPSHPR